MPAGGASAAAGNMIGIAVMKSGFEEGFFGINKNTATGNVPANALYIPIYTNNGSISIGRGNSAGSTNSMDIGIDGSCNVSLANNLGAMGR